MLSALSRFNLGEGQLSIPAVPPESPEFRVATHPVLVCLWDQQERMRSPFSPIHALMGCFGVWRIRHSRRLSRQNLPLVN